ncbi:MAG: DoxX family protein [bacterium]
MESGQFWRKLLSRGVGSRRPAVRVPPVPRIDLFLIRLAPATVFLVHGYLKLFGGYHDRTVALFLTVNIPFAEQAAWFIGALELAGGLALLTGVLIRPLALLLAIEMAVAIAVVRFRQTFVGGWEFELALLLVCLGIALRRWSSD